MRLGRMVVLFAVVVASAGACTAGSTRVSEKTLRADASPASFSITPEPTQDPEPTEPSDTTGAQAECWEVDQSGYFPMPPGTELTAAFETTEDGLAHWRSNMSTAMGVVVATYPPSESRPAPTEASIVSVDVPAYLCYFDGDFGPPRGGQPDSVPNYSRSVIAIGADRVPFIIAQGWIDRLPVVDPNS